jgi:hypothetical protein
MRDALQNETNVITNQILQTSESLEQHGVARSAVGWQMMAFPTMLPLYRPRSEVEGAVCVFVREVRP